MLWLGLLGYHLWTLVLDLLKELDISLLTQLDERLVLFTITIFLVYTNSTTDYRKYHHFQDFPFPNESPMSHLLMVKNTLS